MAEKQRNNISSDNLDRRDERLTLMSDNIKKLGAEIGLSAEVIAWGESANRVWTDIHTRANMMRGEQKVLFGIFMSKFEECRKQAISVKKLLLVLISGTDGAEEVIEEYGLKGAMPRSRNGLKSFVDQLKETSDILRAAGDPRVLSEKIIDDLVKLADEMILLWHDAQQKKQEVSDAFQEVKNVFANDSQILRIVYRYAVYKWGRYSPKLELLGFSPVKIRREKGKPVEDDA